MKKEFYAVDRISRVLLGKAKRLMYEKDVFL